MASQQVKLAMKMVGQVAASAAQTIATKTTKLNLGEDIDDDDVLFASDVELDLAEDEALTEDE